MITSALKLERWTLGSMVSCKPWWSTWRRLEVHKFLVSCTVMCARCSEGGKASRGRVVMLPPLERSKCATNAGRGEIVKLKRCCHCFLFKVCLYKVSTGINKLQATLVRNYHRLTDWLTGVKCRATSLAKKYSLPFRLHVLWCLWRILIKQQLQKEKWRTCEKCVQSLQSESWSWSRSPGSARLFIS